MANRMATAMANRMAKPMRSAWRNDAPNPNPNPKTQNLSSRGFFSGDKDRIRSNGDLGATSFGFGDEIR